MKTKPYPKYKPSGVEWLGEVPEHWGVKRLKTSAGYCVSNVDKLHNDSEKHVRLCNYTDVYYNEFISSDMSFMEATATYEEVKKFHLEAGDVIITKDSEDWRDIAVSALVIKSSPNLVCGYHLARIRPKKGELTGRYLVRQFQSSAINHQFCIAATGVTRYGLPKSAIGEALITLPPLSEQLAIADFLDCETGRIDALIAKKERLLELLAEQRAALISRAVTKGLNPSVKLKPSGVEWLGEVPEHWEEKKVKTLLRAVKGAIKTGPFGSQILSSEMEGEDIKVYNQKNVILKDFTLGENYISLDKYKELIEFKVFPGDFLITTRGTIGRCAIAPCNAETGILHPCLMRLQINKRQVIERFLEILIADSEVIFEQLNIKSNNTTIDVIYQETLKNVVVLLPPLTEQRAIADFLDRETAKIDALSGKVREAIEKLREYRSALISAAVTGKIDVRGGI